MTSLNAHAREQVGFNRFWFILIALAAWGCGKSSNSSGAENSISNIGVPSSTNIASMQGTWKSACFNAAGSPNSSQAEVEFSGSNIHFTWRYFDNSVNCVSADVDERKALYSGRLGVALSSPAGATSVEITEVGTYHMTATGSVATEFNRDSACGRTDWVSGVTREIRTVDCPALLDRFIPFPATARVKVYEVGGKLHFEGDAGTGAVTYSLTR